MTCASYRRKFWRDLSGQTGYGARRSSSTRSEICHELSCGICAISGMTSLLSSTASRRSTVRFASPRYSPKMRLASSTARMMVSWVGIVHDSHSPPLRIKERPGRFVPAARCRMAKVIDPSPASGGPSGALCDRIKHALKVSVQRPHDANACEHRWSARRRNQDKRFHCCLPLGGLMLGLSAVS
jgi:hypothetical protein